MSEEVVSKREWQERLENLFRTWNENISGVDAARHAESSSQSDWRLEDLIGHLLCWRILTIDRLEAAARDVPPPVFPWPDGLTEETDEGTDAINRYFYESCRERSLADLIVETNQQFERIRTAVNSISETDLLTAGRFPWLHGLPLSAVVEGTLEHYYVDHEAEFLGFLGRTQ